MFILDFCPLWRHDSLYRSAAGNEHRILYPYGIDIRDMDRRWRSMAPILGFHLSLGHYAVNLTIDNPKDIPLDCL
jgi:hypothetical protein